MVVGITDFEPMDYKDDSGEWVGFDADMAKMVAEKLANNEIKVVFDIPESAMTFGYAPDVNMRLNSDKLQALGWKPVIGLEEMYTRMMKSMEYTR